MLFGAAILGVLTLVLGVIHLFRRKREETRGWRVRTIGDNIIQYEQQVEESWRSIQFEVVLYAAGVPRHILLLPKDWSVFPHWALGQKKRIIKNLASVYKFPEYTIRYK